MTLEQIRAMSDEKMLLAVAEKLGWADLDKVNIRLWGTRPDRTKGPIGVDEVPNYVTDLNAAMSLVPQGDDKKIWEFGVELSKVIGREFMLRTSTGMAWHYWASFETNKPRAICEAFLLWKGSAT